MRLVSVTFGNVDNNDQYDIAFDFGSGFGAYTNGILVASNNPSVFGINIVGFRVRASGTFIADGLLGNDDFTIARIETASVPLPAGGLLLIGALGGLAALRRRRTVA